ncbi:hypothetical protein NEOLEDRAFT_337248 [Neolentinus lepideus HHB14362 ss-1]|uniref:F-box domain-containing protein n=1 Tax=Neolentinus lepideus HHB14362 ss-1 TaxID=1314782 RepID=A0A165SVL5_9AGAM|nr:hypothetical protein NEOLEDRAFT_337248 [Neolentinus lepideus HHB14362 ss-1]
MISEKHADSQLGPTAPKKARQAGAQLPDSGVDEASRDIRNINNKQNHLARIPLELLAEILSFTPSPRDVLAVARCDKYLHATLVRRSSDFIWRQARRNCRAGAIPDPTPNWTEAAYTAWLFDAGPCEVCRKMTKTVHVSYALRVHLCGNVACHTKFGGSLIPAPTTVAGDAVAGWLLSAESAKFLNAVKPNLQLPTTLEYPTMDRYYRRNDLVKALDDFTKASSGEQTALTQFLVAKESQAKKMPIIMQNAVALQKWRLSYTAKVQEIRIANDITGRSLAVREGWEWADMKATQTFSTFLRAHNNSLQQFIIRDFDFIRDRVDVEIGNLVKRRRRQQEEKSYAQNRAHVALHYQRMLSSGAHQPMPSLTEFHRLSVIKALESSASHASTLDEQLKSTALLKDMLEKDLDKWREKARTRLAAVLGFADWKTVSTRKLHPVDRLTARFVCTLCQKVAKKHQEFGDLDFAGACAHKCPHLDKKQRAKYVWKAEQFAPDEKAIKAIMQLFELSGTVPEDPESDDAVRFIGHRILCLSCDAAIVMDFDRLCMHSKRHEDMQLKLLGSSEVEMTLRFPIEKGLHANVMGPSYQAKRLRALKEYGCRHCIQRREARPEEMEGNDVPPPSDPAPNPESVLKSKPAASAHGTLWDFNGLRSHAKAKHGIQTLGDEDFYRYTSPTTQT